jgi:hypothetical protein
MPFSYWKPLCGTTKLELVVSGRSVAISLLGCGQLSAAAAATAERAKQPTITAKPIGCIRQHSWGFPRERRRPNRNAASPIEEKAP